MASRHVEASLFDPFAPLAWLGSAALDTTAYLGGIVIVATSAIRAAIAPRGESPPFLGGVFRQADDLLMLGIPLVSIVNVGMGSFLSMQAYFGATFVDGSGAVVGVGLVRNLAPLMIGFTMAGLLAAKVVPELTGDRMSLDREPGWVRDRVALDPIHPIEPARLAATRIAASMLIGPVLAIWGAAVGTIVGAVVASSLLGVTFEEFFAMFAGMIWRRDVVGLLAKGIVYGGISGLIACHEGLMPSMGTLLPNRVQRAIIWAGLAILLANSGFFLIFYHGGPAFGPTLLKPPAH